MTLVEAVVGIGLLGTLLVSILTASGRAERQALQADLRIQACEIAEGLLSQWWDGQDSGEQRIPRDERGSVPDRRGWHWRTRLVPGNDTGQLEAETVLLEVFAPNQQAPAARVELLVAEAFDVEL
jgi:hypothetical protein